MRGSKPSFVLAVAAIVIIAMAQVVVPVFIYFLPPVYRVCIRNRTLLTCYNFGRFFSGDMVDGLSLITSMMKKSLSVSMVFRRALLLGK